MKKTASTCALKGSPASPKGGRPQVLPDFYDALIEDGHTNELDGIEEIVVRAGGQWEGQLVQPLGNQFEINGRPYSRDALRRGFTRRCEWWLKHRGVRIERTARRPGRKRRAGVLPALHGSRGGPKPACARSQTRVGAKTNVSSCGPCAPNGGTIQHQRTSSSPSSTPRTKERQLHRRVEYVTGISPSDFRRHILAEGSIPGSTIALVSIAVPVDDSLPKTSALRHADSLELLRAWPQIAHELHRALKPVGGLALAGRHWGPSVGEHVHLIYAGPTSGKAIFESVLLGHLEKLLHRLSFRGIHFDRGKDRVFDWKLVTPTLADVKWVCRYVGKDPTRGGALLGAVPTASGNLMQFGGRSEVPREDEDGA